MTDQLKDKIQKRIVTELNTLLAINEKDIDLKKPFSDYGLDSVQLVSLSGAIAEELNAEIEPTIMWEYPTIEEMINFLSNEYMPK